MTDSTLFEAAIRRVAVFREASDEDAQAIARLVILRAVEEGGFFFLQGGPDVVHNSLELFLISRHMVITFILPECAGSAQ